jgi:hypothetical protein
MPIDTGFLRLKIKMLRNLIGIKNQIQKHQIYHYIHVIKIGLRQRSQISVNPKMAWRHCEFRPPPLPRPLRSLQPAPLSSTLYYRFPKATGI